MDILQWIVIGALVYFIYYLINKYEQRVNDLTRMIELNRDAINKNKENINKNSEGVAQNKEKIENNANGVSKNANGIAKNKKNLDLSQAIIEKLK